jgi:hypothetical protein
VHIFPNPSDGSFTIEMGNLIHSAKVELFDLKGSKLFESEQNESISEYDLSFLALTGMYIVKITHGNQTLEEHIQIH